MDTKARQLFDKFEKACDQMNSKPVVLFARGRVGLREVLMMLCGPTLTLESLAELRKDITECLDGKERQLKGDIGPDMAVFPI